MKAQAHKILHEIMQFQASSCRKTLSDRVTFSFGAGHNRQAAPVVIQLLPLLQFHGLKAQITGDLAALRKAIPNLKGSGEMLPYSCNHPNN